MVELSRSSQSVFYGIIYLLAALGILNAQRMTALERRREYAILAAIGTTPRRVFAQVVTESTLLSLLGGLLGALLGGALVAYHQAHGFDFGGMAEDHSGGFTYMGVTLNVLVFQFSLIAVLIPVAFATAVGALCGLWPGFSSSRLPIPTTIAGRT
jgi:ABC-type antimicrobial peptide transport system permease subunit